MSGYQDALCNIMPVDWLDPYGRTPLAGDAELSVDITIVETDDGIRAKSVKNPPTSGSSRLMNAIKEALGVNLDGIGAEIGSQQAADQGKQDNEKKNENEGSKDKTNEDGNGGKMKPFKPDGFEDDRDRNPGPSGSPGPGRHGVSQDEDEEKAPGR